MKMCEMNNHMSGTSQEGQSDEKKDPTELSIGKIVAWIVGLLTLLGGVANIAGGESIGASILFLIAGVFGIPPTRNMIEDELNVKISRWLAVVIYLVIIFAAGGLASGSV